MNPQYGANGTSSTEDALGMSSASCVPGDTEEPLMAHLFELRDRLAIVLIWLFLGVVVAYPFSAKGMVLIWKEFMNPIVNMTAYSPLEWMLARLQLSLVFALAISVPQFFFQLYRFAGKGLYPNERSFFLKVIPASFLLFILGAAIGYFLVLPAMFKYILFYSGEMATAQLSVQGTLSCDNNSIRFWDSIPASPFSDLCRKNGASKVPDPQKAEAISLQRNYRVFPFSFS